MSKEKNPHGLRARKTTQGVIEIWNGEPGHAESDCLAQFHESYLGSVKDVLAILHKVPVIESNKTYGMKTVEQADDVYVVGNGFLKRNTVKCPDCLVSLHWEQIGSMRVTHEHKPGYSFYKTRCPSCRTTWLVRK